MILLGDQDMTTKTAFVGLVLTLTTLAGCAITGKWGLTDVDPTAARRDFAYQTLTLQQDGTFYADSTNAAGDIETTSGTYTFEQHTLRLQPHHGANRAYKARFVNANTLELKKRGDERTITATFERK